MHADHWHKGVLAALLIAAHGAAHAQNNGLPIDFRLTEEGVPQARPWEKAAILSATIDRDGDDFFEIHVNGEVQADISPVSPRGEPVHTVTLGPNINWDRSTRPGKDQDELKLGLALRYAVQPDIGSIDPNSNPLFYSLNANAEYARTGVYPNLGAAPCNVNPASPLCEKQFNESLRANVSFFPYLAGFEDLTSQRGWAYSIRPQVQIAHDQIIDGTLNATTLARTTGGYTSAMVGLGVQLRPRFISPQIEFNLTGQLRHRLAASDVRRPLIERTAERMEASLTYYFTREDDDSKTADWRVGLSLIWTEGSDPFENKPEASTIVIALRIGRF